MLKLFYTQIKKTPNRFTLILFKLWWIVERKFVTHYTGRILIIK